MPNGTIGNPRVGKRTYQTEWGKYYSLSCDRLTGPVLDVQTNVEMRLWTLPVTPADDSVEGMRIAPWPHGTNYPVRNIPPHSAVGMGGITTAKETTMAYLAPGVATPPQ